MWRANHLHNLIEAEAYDGQEKGEERRELALMRQIVARMADARITEKQLRGPKVEPDKRKERQMPLTPTGRAFPKSVNTPVAHAIAPNQLDHPSIGQAEPQFQIALPLDREPPNEPDVAEHVNDDEKPPPHRLGFGAQPELPYEWGLFDNPEARRAA